MKHILLIEPDKILSENYRLSFQKSGYKIQITHDAQAAIYAVDKIKPDLIVLEIQLASHSGIEFLYELRSYSDWQNIPVIISSIVPREEFSNSDHILFDELAIFDYCDKSKTSLKNLINKIDKKLARI